MAFPGRALRMIQILLASCLSAGALVACGSDHTPTATTVAHPSRLAAESATQILGASAAAVKGARGFRVHATLNQLAPTGQRLGIDFTDYGRDVYEASVTTAAVRVEAIVDGKSAYLRANKQFWVSKAHTDARGVAVLADRWFRAPPSLAQQMSSTFGNLTPAREASCFGQEKLNATVVGHSRVDGQPVVLVHETGKQPGGQPKTVAIALRGPAYPVQVTTTGTRRRGGPKGLCGHHSSEQSVGTATFSYTRIGRLRVPAHVLSMQSLEQHLAPSSNPAATGI
jgi:hypothetical protein